MQSVGVFSGGGGEHSAAEAMALGLLGASLAQIE